MKHLTREQVEKRKAQAVRFTRHVVGDPDRADEIDSETLESYAERRKIQLTNPKRGTAMKSRKQLLDENADLTEECESLQDRLDDILDIAAPEEEEEDPEPGEDD